MRDGETGILTKGDPAALAEAAIGLLLDAERRRAMGARAREVAEQEFDVGLQIDRTLDVYAEPAGPRRPAPAGMTAPRTIRVRFEKAWAAQERRGLLASDPRVRTLRRVLVTYPEVRHIVTDRISLDAGDRPADARHRRPLSRAPAVARGVGGGRVIG